MDLLERIEGIALLITAILGMVASAGTATQLIMDGNAGAFIITIFALMFGLCIILCRQAIKEIKQGGL